MKKQLKISESFLESKKQMKKFKIEWLDTMETFQAWKEDSCKPVWVGYFLE